MKRNLLLMALLLLQCLCFGRIRYDVYPDGKSINSLRGVIEDIALKSHTNPNEDFEVILNEGIYFLEEPLVFNEYLSSAHSVEFIAKEGKNTVISGGEKVSFSKLNDTGEDNMLKASVTNDVRNLWINNARMKKAQGSAIYASDFFEATINGLDLKGLLFPKKDFPYFEDISGLEIIYYQNWRNYYFKVEGIYDNKTISSVSEDVVFVAIKSFDDALEVTPKMIYVGSNIPYYFENSIELMDEPGEWCYSPHNKTIYYYPFDNENIENIDAVIPKIENLIHIKSLKRDEKVENLMFKGLSFSHTNWNWVSENGFFPKQGSTYCIGRDGRDVIPAAVMIEDAKNITFDNCLFYNLGTNGIHIKNDVDSINVDYCRFQNLSGGAICVSDCYHRAYSGDTLPVQNVNISNNHIENIGAEYSSCIGIEAYFCEDLTIAHNELYNLPYSAISVGWGWTMESTTQRNCKVLNNKIIGDTQKCSDGGAIYSLSNFGGDGLLIQGNYIDERTDGFSFRRDGAIYTDEGSSNVKINNNVVMTDRRWFYHHWAGKVEVDSIFVLLENLDNHGGVDAPSGGTDIKYIENGGHIFTLPHELADSIMRNAGIQKNVDDPDGLQFLKDKEECDFDIIWTSKGLQIIPQASCEDNIVHVNIYTIDGCLKKSYFQPNLSIVFADTLKGFYIAEVIYNKQKKVFPLVL